MSKKPAFKVVVALAVVVAIALVIWLIAGRSDDSTSNQGASNNETNEIEMSSPVVPLDETWEGVLGDLTVSGSYDASTKSIQTNLQNTSSQKLCYVQTEPHIKLGDETVGELGPDQLGDLEPDQEAVSTLSVDDEASLANVEYDGYVLHVEVFDCAGPGPQPHSSEGGNEGPEGTEGGSGSEEGSSATLALDATFDEIRAGARLMVSYDSASNTFKGTVENTTASTLTRVRVEIHLDNGVELGPTTPVDLASGETSPVSLQATSETFTGWTAHVEVGNSEAGQSGGDASGN